MSLRGVVILVVSGAVVLLFGNRPTRGAEPESVDFNTAIRPLLSDRCFKCHGPDSRQRRAELRLDRPGDAITAGLIVPGKPDASELIQRLVSSDPDFHMPPPESKLTIGESEVARLRQWIRDGAHYEQHWAFIPPKRHDPPAVPSGAAVRDPLDAFIVGVLDEHGLEPAPEVDRTTWLRRATLTLTGLPPTLDELDAFARDSRPRAYEHVVDRLLASPRFGEHLAVTWLDLARYADTYGYQNDVERDVWPWRDWIIDALNRNLPYDQFATWQIAGDLLPNPTREQRLATTFSRLHRQTNEGGSVEEEFRSEYASDRVHTFGTTFLGLTFECARCHDHKYDPIPTREYYAMTAFFNSIDECGLYSHFTSATPTPTLELPTADQQRRLDELRREVAACENAIERTIAKQRSAFEAWSEKAVPSSSDLLAHYDFEGIADGRVPNRIAGGETPPGRLIGSPKLIDHDAGHALAFSGDNRAEFPKIAEFARFDPFSIALRIRIPQSLNSESADAEVSDLPRAVVLRRSRAWTDAGSQGYQLLIRDGRLEWALIHFWPGDAIAIRTRDRVVADSWLDVVVTSDGSSRANGLALWIDGDRAVTDIVRDHLTRPITGGNPGPLALAERFRDCGFRGGQIDDLRIFGHPLSPIAVRALDHGATPRAVAAAWRDANDDERYGFYLENHDAEYRAARSRLRDARHALADTRAKVREIMVMADLPEARPTYVLDRGRYDAPKERVQRSTPTSVLPLDAALPRNRLGLARWLFDPRHPLAARVQVNRLWQFVFGHGIVATPDNFGSQGSPPSHRELLDTLAVDYRESGWDTKAMLKRYVLSATFRQESRASLEARAVDPTNRWWSRGPSYRLSAEVVRDSALFASGLLVEHLGGPSVHPCQPEGLWREKGNVVYHADSGDGLYRRSLYTIWKRTSPPPSMMIFDAAKRDVCIARRQTTSTPLQSLVLFNDPQFVEAARVFACRIFRDRGIADADRIPHAFRVLTGHAIGSDERRPLDELFSAERQEFEDDPKAANELLAVGGFKFTPPLETDAERADVAALAVVISTLLGYDAFLQLR